MGSTNLTGLSGGFTPNTWYGWWMRVYGANGFGDSFYYRWVMFSSLGSVPESGLIPFSSLGYKDDMELNGVLEILSESRPLDNHKHTFS